MMLLSCLAAAALGALGWTLAEYLIHRFDGHGMKGKTPFSKEHLAHHADPSTFAATWKKAVVATVVVSLLGAGGHALVGLPGVAFAVGFTAMYVAYEVIHRRIHTHAPLHAYAAWARRHHLVHHHVAPRCNHGVTTSLWDHAFGTWQASATVRVPRRHAPHWLVDGDEVRAPYQGTYQLAGRKARA